MEMVTCLAKNEQLPAFGTRYLRDEVRRLVGGQFTYRETFYLRRLSYDVPWYDNVFMHTTTSVRVLYLSLASDIAMSYCATCYLLRRSRFPRSHMSRIASSNANPRQTFA